MPPKPSALLQELRAAIRASGLSTRKLRALVPGSMSHNTVQNILVDDGMLPNSATVVSLALGLSRSEKCLAYWKARHHPSGLECVDHWMKLYSHALPESRRATRAETLLVLPTLQRSSPSTDELHGNADPLQPHSPLLDYCKA